MTLDWHKVVDKDFRDSRSFIEAIDQTQGVEVCWAIVSYSGLRRGRENKATSARIFPGVPFYRTDTLKRRLLTSAGWHENIRLSGPFISTIAPTCASRFPIWALASAHSCCHWISRCLLWSLLQPAIWSRAIELLKVAEKSSASILRSLCTSDQSQAQSKHFNLRFQSWLMCLTLTCPPCRPRRRLHQARFRL